MFKNRQFCHWQAQQSLLLFVISLYLLLTGYKSMRLGHFGDGVIYNSIARNMAEGFGSFWQPYFSQEIFPVFYEHPPLVMYLKSWFFYFFGDGVYFEGFYAIFIGAVLLFLTAKLWQISKISQTDVHAWWPLLLVVVVPFFSYALDTGLLMVTFSVLFLLSIYCAYQAVFSNHPYRFAFASGVLIYLGILAKGPVALGTLALPGIAYLVFKTHLKFSIKITTVMLLVCVVLFITTWYVFPESQQFWQNFWHNQVVSSLTGTRGEHSYTRLPKHFLGQIVAPLLVVFLVFIFQRRKNNTRNISAGSNATSGIATGGIATGGITFNRHSVFFILLALANSLPFFLSPRQANHYIFHSWFLWSLALAHLSQTSASRMQRTLAKNRRYQGAVIALSIVIIASSIFIAIDRKDHLSRRKDFYADFYLQNIVIPARSNVGLCPYKVLAEGNRNEKIYPSLQRLYRGNITKQKDAPFLIVDKTQNCTIGKDYKRVHKKETRRYILYQKQ